MPARVVGQPSGWQNVVREDLLVSNANLVMGLFWLVLGVGLIVAQWFRPDLKWLRLLGTDLSIGWAAIVLCVYNFVRWWSVRSYTTNRRRIDDAYERRRQTAERRGRTEKQEPDPTFDFSDPPRPGPEERGPDAAGDR
jgi:hypothetical protein